MKIILLPILSIVFCLTSTAQNLDPFSITVSGRAKDEALRKTAKQLHFLEVVKEGNKYILRGVMTTPDKDVYIWRGEGTIVKGELTFKYSPVCGKFAGELKDAKLYNNNNSIELLFDKMKYELFETQ